ncbi:flagellar basal body-associated FliL family protein [Sulfurimonas sp.]|nr:flagellar basal body-associated FliL family protein [Sulfurimonas sp.]
MKIEIEKINLHKIIKKAIYIVSALILILLATVGVLTSEFKKIKKFDNDKQSLRSMITSIRKGSNKHYSTKVSVDPTNQTASLGDFTFNIANEKMLILNISMNYVENAGDIQEEIETKGDILRDAVINTMLSKFDVNSNEHAMKREIKRELNSELSEGEVDEIYFNKFIYQ